LLTSLIDHVADYESDGFLQYKKGISRMPTKRLTLAAALVSVLFASGPVLASPSAVNAAPVIASVGPQLLTQASAFSPAAMLAQSAVPAYAAIAGTKDNLALARNTAKTSNTADQGSADDQNSATANLQNISDVRKALISLAMNLRDIRYVRGGRDPSTGFDCSGFVRYVFAHAIGMQLPTNSASQFLSGLKVARADMKPGDLVFFRTHGKRNISHVGIYISNGQFIHSPTTGQSVQVSSLDEAYWAKHFAGAKRPEAMAMVDHHG
jgi:cell wall-associated NlpC family hydrolase